ncbi:MAG: DUF5677 domain-containing protein [Victivallales bacterium]
MKDNCFEGEGHDDHITEGALGKSIEKVIVFQNARYQEYYSILKELNREVLALFPRFKFRNNDVRKMLAVTMYVRLIATYQSVLLVTERGMLAQGKILLRPCIELLFAIVAMHRHKDLYREIIYQFDLEQERILKNLKIADDPALRAPFETPEAEKRLAEIKNGIRDRKTRKLTIKEISRLAGLEDYYRTAYMELSWSVHNSVIDLENHFILNSCGLPEVIDFAPVKDQEEFRKVLLTAGTCLSYSSQAITSMFDLDGNAFIEYQKRLGQMIRMEKNEGKCWT